MPRLALTFLLLDRIAMCDDASFHIRRSGERRSRATQDPRDLPIWHVNFKTKEVTQLHAAARTAMNYNCCDILKIAFLLSSRGLPTSIVNHILDDGSFWAEIHVETSANVRGDAPFDEEYLRLAIPAVPPHSALEFKECSELRFECVSHDQGWASYHPDHPDGTYSANGCWSWVEFEIVGIKGDIVVPRETMCCNLRASNEFRRHLLIINDRRVLDRVLPGSQVVLFLRAKYPGWSNHARFGRISARFAWGLKETVAMPNFRLETLSLL
jgi:hypothetical protein